MVGPLADQDAVKTGVASSHRWLKNGIHQCPVFYVIFLITFFEDVSRYRNPQLQMDEN